MVDQDRNYTIFFLESSDLFSSFLEDMQAFCSRDSLGVEDLFEFFFSDKIVGVVLECSAGFFKIMS